MPPKKTSHHLSRPALYHKTTLKNGVRVVSESLPYVRSVSLGVWANVGSRDESFALNGISHFIEHMVFKGTRRRSIQNIAQSLESLGGYLNAFTTKEQTCFYARVLDSNVAEAMDVLSDIVMHATFKKKELEKEKLVVIEELKNAEDDPEDIIHDYFEKALFPSTRSASRSSGRRKTCAASGARTSGTMWRATTGPSPSWWLQRATSTTTLVRLAEKYLGRHEPSTAAQPRPAAPQETGSPACSRRNPADQPGPCLLRHRGLQHPPQGSLPGDGPERLLGEGMSSRLYQTDPGKARIRVFRVFVRESPVRHGTLRNIYRDGQEEYRRTRWACAQGAGRPETPPCRQPS